MLFVCYFSIQKVVTVFIRELRGLTLRPIRVYEESMFIRLIVYLL